MCGITAFIGQAEALSFLVQGLEKLEYRGYDSAGITLVGSQKLDTFKTKGRLIDLENILQKTSHPQTCGIGHTRWATHGIPNQLNAHPHNNANNTLSIVHNGIIENHQAIRTFLKQKGYSFISQTDSECIVNLIDYYYQDNLLEATQKAVKKLEGSFALCVVSSLDCREIIVAKKESPMIIGHSGKASFCASDIPALLEYTQDVMILEDNQIAVLKEDGVAVFDFELQSVQPQLMHIPYDIQTAQKGGYETFMLKEIYEQPSAIQETLRHRIKDNDVVVKELESVDWNFECFEKVYLIACGTAYHASLYGKYLLEKWTQQNIECLPASEFRYGNSRISEHTLCILISQSGETADTLAALKLAKEKQAKTIAMTNVLGSSLSRLADITLYTYAGPEIAVASTKAYTTQLVLLCILMIALAKKMGYEQANFAPLLKDLKKMPEIIAKTLREKKQVEDIMALFKNQKDAYFIGRQLDYISVLEGALKLKEISYIHADAYYAGELKHGPIALIEKGSIVIALATQKETAAKTISNIEETRARQAQVILISTPQLVTKQFQNMICIPNVHPDLTTLPVTIILQEIAYYAAVQNQLDVDKPRNLAKSVTVE